MSLINPDIMINEILYFLRNNLTDPKSRGTTTTENFTATSGQTQFSLSNNPSFNIISVKVDGNTKSYGSDWTVSFTKNSTTITLTNALSGGESVDIKYHYGSTWIYKDWPRVDLKVSSYPRIGIRNIATSDRYQGLSLQGMDSTITFQVGVFYEKINDARDMMFTIKEELWNNRLNFHYFSGISPVGQAGPGRDMLRKGEIYVGDMDFIIPIQPQT